MKILILNGPNINMLGIREPQIYGTVSYNDMIKSIEAYAKSIGVTVSFYQSNHEGDLIDAIQKAYFDRMDGIVFNPGGYTHTSIALADAVKSVGIPTVEVHISDIKTREDYRKFSYISEVAVHTVSGLGINGYNVAIDLLKSGYNLYECEN